MRTAKKTNEVVKPKFNTVVPKEYATKFPDLYQELLKKFGNVTIF